MIALIAAMSENGVIGINGKLPWDIPEDRRLFKELTKNSIVIMGRRTFEEIARPLPNRMIYVVSHTTNFDVPGSIQTVDSLETALKLADKKKNIFIAGGSKLYQEALDIADVMYITLIESTVQGDTYFPKFNESDYQKSTLLFNRINEKFPFIQYKYVKKTDKVEEENKTLNFKEAIERNEDYSENCGFHLGDIVKHFKREYLSNECLDDNSYLYKILAFGTHTETLEPLVIYESLYKDANKGIKLGQVFVRPLSMFTSRVDKKKYPDAKQTFRFEKFDIKGDK